jgi:peptidylprolyl isomerase
MMPSRAARWSRSPLPRLSLAAVALSLHAGAGLPAAQPAAPPARPAIVLPQAPPDVKGPPADAEKTASGLAFRILQPAEGDARPQPTDFVSVHYSAWTTDGKAFDSTSSRGRPSLLALERIMKGMNEGIQLMVVGERRRFWIPEALAFEGMSGRPEGMVVLDIELLDFFSARRSARVRAAGSACTTRGGPPTG